MFLLTEGNSKALKSREHGYLTATLELAPGKLGGAEVCPERGQCYATCVFKIGFGTMPTVWKKRVERTQRWLKNPTQFKTELEDDIATLCKRARDKGLRPAVRLNTFSDIDWSIELGSLFDRWTRVQFYDYTKVAKRVLNKAPIANYHLVYSVSERSEASDVATMLRMGKSVTVVIDEQMADSFRTGKLMPSLVASKYRFSRWYDGDEHDLTFLRPNGSVIFLSAKGGLKKKPGSFVMNYWSIDADRQVATLILNGATGW